jgi:hypothetical protein
MYGWIRQPWAGTPPTTTLGQLGQLVVHDKNPYHQIANNKLAHKITFDSTPSQLADPDAWKRLYEKEFKDKKGNRPTWKLRGGPPPLNFDMEKSLRIPYIAFDQNNKEVVEHLLVGYSSTQSPTTADFQWAGSPNLTDLEKLGDVLISETPVSNTALDVMGINGWSGAGLVEYDPAQSQKNVCDFRERSYKAELVIAMPLAIRAGGGWQKWWLFVGYEGGGGY